MFHFYTPRKRQKTRENVKKPKVLGIEMKMLD